MLTMAALYACMPHPECAAGYTMGLDGLCVVDTGTEADTDTDSDTDTDADSDSDADTDTDTDSDTDVVPPDSGDSADPVDSADTGGPPRRSPGRWSITLRGLWSRLFD